MATTLDRERRRIRAKWPWRRKIDGKYGVTSRKLSPGEHASFEPALAYPGPKSFSILAPDDPFAAIIEGSIYKRRSNAPDE
jgi:hypothetical protein